MKYILGEKIEMSQIFDATGNVIPVTLIYVPKNTILQIRTKEKDGYSAVQVGMGTRREKNVAKPQRGHSKDLGVFKKVREFRGETSEEKRGDTKDVSLFSVGDIVKVSSVSKGKGFQGVMKRHGFHGAPASHGTKHAHREPGSIGATWPQRVIKGMRMAGRMGGDRVSVRKISVIAVDTAENILALRGPVPGSRGSLVEIRGI